MTSLERIEDLVRFLHEIPDEIKGHFEECGIDFKSESATRYKAAYYQSRVKYIADELCSALDQLDED